jgi:regulator of sirC expression with transglutaminase-like and TPR domain
VDATRRWHELMQCPEDSLPLDEAALIIAAHANPALDVAFQLHRLDQVAGEVREADTSAVCEVLFEHLGLRGDHQSYDDPRNSYIDQVLDRRRGIPISLSVMLIEVGRRCGLHLEGVGMPGHFLVRDTSAPHLLIDAFDGGQRLDRSGCQHLLRLATGTRSRLTSDMLATTGRRAILARMLANLDRSFARRADGRSLRWVSTLRLAIADLPPGDRLQLAERLASLGCFSDAARLLDDLADALPVSETTDRLQAEASALRARLN